MLDRVLERTFAPGWLPNYQSLNLLIQSKRQFRRCRQLRPPRPSLNELEVASVSDLLRLLPLCRPSEPSRASEPSHASEPPSASSCTQEHRPLASRSSSLQPPLG